MSPGEEEPGEGAPTPKPPPEGERRGKPDRRGAPERRQDDVPVPKERRSGIDRRSLPDRRGGAYELDRDTLDLIEAVNAYKERTGKTFPTWSDIVEIFRELGWERRAPQ